MPNTNSLNPTAVKPTLACPPDPLDEIELELGILEVIAFAASDPLFTHLAWQRARGIGDVTRRANWPGDASVIETLAGVLYQLGGVAL